MASLLSFLIDPTPTFFIIESMLNNSSSSNTSNPRIPSSQQNFCTPLNCCFCIDMFLQQKHKTHPLSQ